MFIITYIVVMIAGFFIGRKINAMNFEFKVF